MAKKATESAPAAPSEPQEGSQAPEGAPEPPSPENGRQRVASDPQPLRIGRTFMVLPTNRSLVETFPSDEPGPEHYETVDPQPEDFEEFVRQNGQWDR